MLTSAIASAGLRVGVPFDIQNGWNFDLSKAWVQQLIKSWIIEGRIWYIHLGTPCTLYSIARKKTSQGVKFRISCTLFTAEVIRLCHIHGVYFTLENPKTSRLFKLPCVSRALEFDCCRYGILFGNLHILPPTFVG